MDLGERIREQIGPEVLDQIIDDLVEGLVRMARARQASLGSRKRNGSAPVGDGGSQGEPGSASEEKESKQ